MGTGCEAGGHEREARPRYGHGTLAAGHCTCRGHVPAQTARVYVEEPGGGGFRSAKGGARSEADAASGHRTHRSGPTSWHQEAPGCCADHGPPKVPLVVRPIMTPASDPAAVALIPSTPTDGDLVSDDDGPGFEDDSVDTSSAASPTADNSDEEDNTLTGFSGAVETVHGPVRSSAGRRRRRLQCQKIRRGSMVITAEQGINFLLDMTSDRKVLLK